MSDADSRIVVEYTTDTSASPHKSGEAGLYVMFDSARPGRKLWFTQGEWDAFVLGVRAGEFDLDEDGSLPPVPDDAAG